MKKTKTPTRERTQGRAECRCSSCGVLLPKTKLGWGLIWHDGSGMCAKCLYKWRKTGGYFEDLRKKKERAEQKELEKLSVNAKMEYNSSNPQIET
jgi:hypothetical protein